MPTVHSLERPAPNLSEKFDRFPSERNLRRQLADAIAIRNEADIRATRSRGIADRATHEALEAREHAARLKVDLDASQRSRH